MKRYIKSATSREYAIEYYTNAAAAERRPTYAYEVEENYITDRDEFDSDLDAIQYAIYDIVGDEDVEINTVKEGIDYLDSVDLGMGYPIICKITGPSGIVYDSGMDMSTFLEDAIEDDEDEEYYEYGTVQ